MIGIPKRLSLSMMPPVPGTRRPTADERNRARITLVVVVAIVVGDFGVPFPSLVQLQDLSSTRGAAAAPVADAISAVPRCGCAKAGTADCCCTRRAAAQGAKSCCGVVGKASAPRQIAAKAGTRAAASHAAESRIPAFNACACGEGGRPGLLLSHQPRLTTAEIFGDAMPESAKLEIREPAVCGYLRLAPEPPRPKSLCG